MMKYFLSDPTAAAAPNTTKDHVTSHDTDGQHCLHQNEIQLGLPTMLQSVAYSHNTSHTSQTQ